MDSAGGVRPPKLENSRFASSEQYTLTIRSVFEILSLGILLECFEAYLHWCHELRRPKAEGGFMIWPRKQPPWKTEPFRQHPVKKGRPGELQDLSPKVLGGSVP